MDRLGEIELGQFIREDVDMRYGAMNFPVRPVLQELKEIANLGFDYVELVMDPPLNSIFEHLLFLNYESEFFRIH